MDITTELLMELNNKRDRVRNSFPLAVNRKIDEEVMGRMIKLSGAGSEAIQRRMGELDYEWDIDRALMLAFAVIGGATLGIGLSKNRKLLRLLGVQLTFLLNHSAKGWCPPASVFRRLGFRTQKEIEAERHALVSSLRENRVQSRDELRNTA